MKKNRKLISVLIVSLLILFSVNNISITAEENTPTFELSVPKTEYNVGDIFEVSLRLKNVRFNGLQVTLYFDPDVVRVVDSNGNETDKFNQGSTIKCDLYNPNTGEGIFAQIGTNIDNSKGLVDHMLYIFPSQHILKDGIYSVEEEWFDYFSIRFKAIKKGDPNIHFANEESPEYKRFNPSGYIVSNLGVGTECELIIPTIQISEKTSLENINNKNNIHEDTIVFIDVDHVFWAKEYIEELYKLGIVNGVGDSKFEPDRNVNREEFTKMLVEVFDFEIQETIEEFSDVDTSAWYYEYISTAKSLGVVNGIGDNRFGVGTLISRQDMTVMAYRAAQVAGINIPEGKEANIFMDDAEIADYAKEAIEVMQKADIVNGIDSNIFAPKENATRAQAAKIIYMLLSAK